MTEKYTVYNKMYVKGKPEGREYRVESASTKAEAIRIAEKANRQWNKLKSDKKENVYVKISSVKKTGVKRTAKRKPQPRTMSPFGIRF